MIKSILLFVVGLVLLGFLFFFIGTQIGNIIAKKQKKADEIRKNGNKHV